MGEETVFDYQNLFDVGDTYLLINLCSIRNTVQVQFLVRVARVLVGVSGGGPFNVVISVCYGVEDSFDKSVEGKL